MGTTTIRLSEKDKAILNELTKHYKCKQSTIIRKAIYEMYEDMKDLEAIEEFEQEEKEGNIEWVDNEEVGKLLKISPKV